MNSSPQQYDSIGSPRLRMLFGTPKQDGAVKFKPSPPSSMRKPTPPSAESGGSGGGRPSPHSRYGLTPRLDSTGSLLPQPHLTPERSPLSARPFALFDSQDTPRSTFGKPPTSSRPPGTAEETTYPFTWVRQMHAIVLQSSVDLSFGKALERVAEAGKALTNCKHVQIFFLERVGSHTPGQTGGGGLLLRLKGKGTQDKVFPCEGLAGVCAQDNVPIACNRPHHDARFNPEIDWAPGSGVKTTSCVPMTTLAGKVVGVIQCSNKVQGGFGETDLQAMDMLARQAAVTFDLCIQSEARQAQYRKVNTMLKGFVKLASQPTTAELAHKAGLLVKEVTGASQANCFILDENGEALSAWTKKGDSRADVYSHKKVPIKGFLSEVLRDAKGLGPMKLPGQEQSSVKHHLGSLYCPIVAKHNQPAGIIQVRSKKTGHFTEVDENLASLLAAMVGTIHTNFSRGNTVAGADSGRTWESIEDAMGNIRQMMSAAVNVHTVKVLFHEPRTRVFWTLRTDRKGESQGGDKGAARSQYWRFPADTFPLNWFVETQNALSYPPGPNHSLSDADAHDLRMLGRRFLHEDLHLESMFGVPLTWQGACVGVVLLINKHNSSGPFEQHVKQTAQVLAVQWGGRLNGTLHEQRMLAELSKLDVTIQRLPTIVAGEGKGGGAASEADAGLVKTGTRLPNVLVGLSDYIAEYMQAESCWIFVLDKKSAGMVWAMMDTSRGLVKIELAQSGMARGVMEKGQKLLIPNVDEDPSYDPWLAAEVGVQVRSLLCTPLASLSNGHNGKGQVIGSVQVMNKRGEVDIFSDKDTAQLEMLGSLVVSLIENAENLEELFRLQEGVRVSFDQRNSILDQTAALHFNPSDQPGLLTRVRALSRTLVMAGECNVFIAGHNFSTMYELSDDMNAHCTLEHVRGIVGYVMKSGSIVFHDSLNKDSNFDVSVDARNVVNAHSLLCTPILDEEGSVLGAIQVLNSLSQDYAFAEEDGQFLLRLGKHLGAAFKNSQTILKMQKCNDKLDRLAQCQGLSEQIKHVTQSLQSVVTAERVNVFVRDGSILRAHDEVSGLKISVNVGVGYVGRCAQDKVTTIVADVLKDRRFLPSVDGRAAIELSHAMYVPVLNSAGECVLAVEMMNKSSGPFDSSDEQVATILSAHLLGVKHKDSQRQAHDDARRAALGLLTASQYLFPLTADPDAMISTAIQQIGHLCNAKARMYLAVRNEEDVQDDVWKCYEEGSRISAVPIQGLPGECFRKAAAIVIKSQYVGDDDVAKTVEGEEAQAADESEGPEQLQYTSTFLCQPLMDGVMRRPVGVIELRRIPEGACEVAPFSANDQELVSHLANLVVQSMVHHAKLLAKGNPFQGSG